MLRRRRAITNDNGQQLSPGMRLFLETGDSSQVSGEEAHEVLRIRRERRKSRPVVDQDDVKREDA